MPDAGAASAEGFWDVEGRDSHKMKGVSKNCLGSQAALAQKFSHHREIRSIFLFWVTTKDPTHLSTLCARLLMTWERE